MKNINNKVYIDPFVYIILFIALITGMFKSILIMFIIIFFHELGHIITLKKYNYEIKRIEFYPFGGITKTNKSLNSPINEEIIIAISGALFQIILIFIFTFFNNFDLITTYIYQLFLKYNLTILIFNLLPIIPLDGSILIKSLLEKFFSFKTAYFINLIISIIFIVLFITYNYIFSLNNYVIITFLLYKNFYFFKNFKHFKNRFLLERYLYRWPYNNIANEKHNNVNKLKKETLHFFKRKNRYIHEKTLLSEMFDNT